MKGPDLNIKTVAIETIEYDPFNVREHDERNVDAIKASIARFGQQKPIVVKKDGTVIAGNGTLGAMRMLGYKEIVIAETELDGEEAVAFSIADNRTAELATWDDQALAQALDQLDDELLPASGFDEDEMAELLERLEPSDIDPSDAPEAQTDRADDLQDKWGVKRGDLWVIGDHRLMCGDATSVEDFTLLMNGKKADMCFTSPPYNGNTHLDYGKGDSLKLYEDFDDNKSSEEYISFTCTAFDRVVENTRGFFFCNIMYNANSRWEFLQIAANYKDKLWETIIWEKIGIPIPSGLTRDFELIFCFNCGAKGHLGEKFNRDSNLWKVSNRAIQDKKMHRACFPVGLPARAIGLVDCEAVLDPFLGSGTTMIAAEQLDRRCYGMELEPKYCAVILERMADMGLEPRLDGSRDS